MRTMSLAMRTAVIAGIFALSSAPTVAARGEPARAEVQDAAPRHAIAMHGAPKYPPNFAHFDYVNPAAPKGGKVKLVAIGTFDSLNQFIIRGVSAASLGYLYDSLITSSSDEAFTVYGLLAETIETPKDRSWVAFTLRAEARFHDGTPVTVDDVIFSFNILREKGRPFWSVYYGNVVKVEKTAARRVKFSFKPGENRELPLILGQFPILPKAYWQNRDFAKTTLEAPLGSGPYRIEAVDPGRSITYRRVADYWGRNLAVNVGAYNFDVIRIDYYRDATVAREAFKTKGFDYRAENESKAWATAYDVPAVKDGRLIKRTFAHKRSAGMQSFAFNTRREMFKDSRVREALGYAFDFEWTNKNLFYGQYRRTRSYFSNSELASTGLPKGGELEILERFRGRIPERVFTEEYRPPVYDGSGNIRAGRRSAMRILKQAGWVVRNKKLVNAKTGKQMRFEILLNSPAFERVVLPFVRNLKRLGIRARARLVDPAQYENRVRDFDFDMIVGSFGQSLSPGNEQRNTWSSRAADFKGSRNIIGIKDPVIDELIELVIAAPDRKGLIDRVRALDRVLLWNHFVIPQWHIAYDRRVFWNMFGIPKVIPMLGSSFDLWWIDAAKVAALDRRMSKTKAN
ncbi:MAG: extracellular solute-binding protein [Alphaproteobacteria bacterium]|nr:extracellular solute-binding protein [Alphaproteobacteria bacterium]MCZ6743825.1 extracellular solute-binding protein [Alphaproteobacteria bacterium]